MVSESSQLPYVTARCPMLTWTSLEATVRRKNTQLRQGFYLPDSNLALAAQEDPQTQQTETEYGDTTWAGDGNRIFYQRNGRFNSCAVLLSRIQPIPRIPVERFIGKGNTELSAIAEIEVARMIPLYRAVLAVNIHAAAIKLDVAIRLPHDAHFGRRRQNKIKVNCNRLGDDIITPMTVKQPVTSWHPINRLFIRPDAEQIKGLGIALREVPGKRVIRYRR